MAVYTLWNQVPPQNLTPPSQWVVDTPGGVLTNGVYFRVHEPCVLRAIWQWNAGRAGTNTPTAVPHAIGLYLNNPQWILARRAWLTSADWSGPADSGWIRAAFDTPYPLEPDVWYVAVIGGGGASTGGTGPWYAWTTQYFGASPNPGFQGVTSGPLYAPSAAASPRGVQSASASFNNTLHTFTFPAGAWQNLNNWIDPEVETWTPAPSVTPYQEAVAADLPFAWWRLDEPAGAAQALDSSGLRWHSASIGGTLFGQNPGGIPPGLGSRVARSPSAQSGSAITIPDLNPGEWSQFTIEMWLRAADVTGNRYLLANGQTWVTPFAGLDLRTGANDPTWNFITRLGVGGSAQSITSGFAPVAGTWYHYAVRHTGANVQHYVNGQQVGTGAGNNTGWRQSAQGLGVLWNPQDNRPFPGWASNVAIYPNALTPERILAHYRAGMTPLGPSGAQMKAWTGSAWADAELKQWTGTGWAPVRTWTGTEWIPEEQ